MSRQGNMRTSLNSLSFLDLKKRSILHAGTSLQVTSLREKGYLYIFIYYIEAIIFVRRNNFAEEMRLNSSKHEGDKQITTKTTPDFKYKETLHNYWLLIEAKGLFERIKRFCLRRSVPFHAYISCQRMQQMTVLVLAYQVSKSFIL